MTDITAGSSRHGTFSAPSNPPANGSLTLAGGESRLQLWSDTALRISANTTITGVLDDLTRVSIIGCNVRAEGHVGKGAQIRYTYHVTLQCALFGSRHVSENEGSVRAISFALERAVALFHDPEAYGTVFNDAATTAMVARIDNPQSSFEVRESSWISYYTGKRSVFTTDTAIGRVSANHIPTLTIGNDQDHGLQKGTELSIEFDEPLAVTESLHRMGRVLQFIDLVMGHSQSVASVNVHTGLQDPSHSLELYAVGYAPRQSASEQAESGNILRTTVLVHPVDNSTEFAEILGAWLDRDEEWRTARTRLAHDWGKPYYGYNRTIAAANVFDLLPSSVYGNKPSLTAELSGAVEDSIRMFRSLPQSQERDDVLGYLGRIGDWRLKRKVAARSDAICSRIGQLLPEFKVVTDEAVNLRNHYVHGSPSRIRGDKRLQLQPFLTNSLEFTFFASDFIDAGWNIAAWCRNGRPMGHPFHNFLVNYKDNLRVLKDALE